MIRLPICFKSRADTEAELTEMLRLEELIETAINEDRHVVVSVTDKSGTHTFYPKVASVGEVSQS